MRHFFWCHLRILLFALAALLPMRAIAQVSGLVTSSSPPMVWVDQGPLSASKGAVPYVAVMHAYDDGRCFDAAIGLSTPTLAPGASLNTTVGATSASVQSSTPTRGPPTLSSTLTSANDGPAVAGNAAFCRAWNYVVAAAAERYAGVWNDYASRTASQLRETIRSTESTIAEHQGFLRDPLSKSGMTAEKWANMSQQARDGLLKKWGNDIERNQSYLEIAKKALEDK